MGSLAPAALFPDAPIQYGDNFFKQYTFGDE